ncbi:T9SS type A sorting domain-containing protein [Flavilitoribacter nigricans]|uniref:Pectate lyase n=1 Tax=Flavilitoribacter nigricans (strain ATCC 23147 / DSM 23189 / NBRC 102662 / NCIMB 1420 / SS-2) TaxID=1122177 RepID=A0A2D0N1M5_FLAN2|nr:T9SS type A sorting domain-containing protein [Flavilitoribacter nigricans]PHN02442.1 pectate lyase [Flavilitoribacter nigricans DSM 23189 = NBRC 102662]
MNDSISKKLILFLCGMSLTWGAFAQVVAFPGAEGYGRFASGGRGDGLTNEVIEVTTLEDDLDNPPAGSLRWAFDQAIVERQDPILGSYLVKLPITIVFRVGGVINLKGELRVDRDNMTIAGQTAPGDGICIRGATTNFSGSRNLIVRHIRFRPGDELGEETSAFRIENGGNFIIDHCSMSWAIEETTHFSSNENTTVQWCIISESLYQSIHKKGNRGYATQWGGEYASYHHNLLAHHNSRMPRINGSNRNDVESLVDYRNNVNYNWGSRGAFYGGEFEGTDGQGFSYVNVVNNYFKPGPATNETIIFAHPSYNRSGVEVDGYADWYFSGNVMVGYPEMTENNWQGVDASSVGGVDNIRSETVFVKTDGALEQYADYTESAEEAYTSVLAGVGANLPRRDTIDARVIAEVDGQLPIERYVYETEDGTQTPVKGTASGLIDTQWNLVPDSLRDQQTAWDVYETSVEAPIDTDHDGIPDEWEIARGLDPMDYNDGRTITANGYSNLENYLNNTDHTVATYELDPELPFKVYPNPTAGQLTIECAERLQRVDVFNLSGQLMQSVRNEAGIHSVNVEGLPAGMYVLRALTINRKIVSQKVLIAKD